MYEAAEMAADLERARVAIVLLIAAIGMLSGYILTTPPRELPWWFRMERPEDDPICPLHKLPRSSCERYHKDD